MPICFFDTCALKHRYIGSPQGPRISRLIGRRSNRCHIADLTVLEMPCALGGHCRDKKLGVSAYDLMDHRFLADIAHQRLLVRQTSKLNVLRARNLLRLGGVIRRRNMGSGDALIASCGLDLAHDLKERISFYTADWTLYTTLRDINAFTAAMTLHYILPPKAGIPATT
jgi:hypothetical protein